MKKNISNVDQEIISLELEKSRLDREKSILILNKGLFLYFCFLFVAVIGFINNFVNKLMLNVLILMGLVVLVISTLPYIGIMRQEEKRLSSLIDSLKSKRGASK